MNREKKNIIIAISGPAGSGKTTYAKILAKKYGLRYFSAGSIFREIAKSRGLTLEELSRIAEKDPSIDLEIDKRTLEEASKGNVVVEGHLVAWVVKDIADVKIYVKAPLLERVKRIALRENRPIEEVLHETVNRENSQRKRFYEYYGIDTRDLSIFDLVIDTSRLSIDDVIELIENFVKRILSSSKE